MLLVFFKNALQAKIKQFLGTADFRRRSVCVLETNIEKDWHVLRDTLMLLLLLDRKAFSIVRCLAYNQPQIL